MTQVFFAKHSANFKGIYEDTRITLVCRRNGIPETNTYSYANTEHEQQQGDQSLSLTRAFIEDGAKYGLTQEEAYWLAAAALYVSPTCPAIQLASRDSLSFPPVTRHPAIIIVVKI